MAQRKCCFEFPCSNPAALTTFLAEGHCVELGTFSEKFKSRSFDPNINTGMLSIPDYYYYHLFTAQNITSAYELLLKYINTIIIVV